MKIRIVSADKRYIKVNELLLQRGYDSFISSYEDRCGCDCLLLSVRDELKDEQLRQLFQSIDKKTTVLCGNGERIKGYFSGKVIDYGKDSDFLLKNAVLTAEATLPYLYEATNASLFEKRIFVAGYGRIGKALCKLLKSMGMQVEAYARRAEVVAEMRDDGVAFADLSEGCRSEIIINTVPFKIFTGDIMARIPEDTQIIDLASAPYGFEDMTKVKIASGLPGKYLPVSASAAVFDTVCKSLSSNESEGI